MNVPRPTKAIEVSVLLWRATSARVARRPVWFALTVVLTIGVISGFAVAGRDAESSAPIEGYWILGSPLGSSFVVAKPGGVGFEGIKVATAGGTNPCAAAEGIALFRVSGSGMRYTGAQRWQLRRENPPSCEYAYATDAVLELNYPDLGKICSSSPWDGHRDCSTLTRGCPEWFSAANGGPACVGTGTKPDARLASTQWEMAALAVDRIRRRLRGGDRRLLRSLAIAFSAYQHKQASAFKTIAKDPPDADYRHVARPRRVVMRRGRPSAKRALLRNFARANAVGQALVTAIDRAAGARMGGDAQALAAQNAAAKSYAAELRALMQKQPALARRVAKRLRPRSRNGRRLVKQVRAPAFAARVALSRSVLQAFITQNT
jgi:hypothetical protein